MCWRIESNIDINWLFLEKDKRASALMSETKDKI